MEDIESAKSENSNIRRIQNKLLQWEIPDHPLAPLSTVQREIFYELSQVLQYLICSMFNASNLILFYIFLNE